MSSGSCRKTTGTGRGWDTLGHAGPSFTKPSPANDNGIASNGLEPAQPDTKGKRIHHSLAENAGISERPCPHGLCPTEASQVGVKAQREAKYLVRASTHTGVSRPLQTASWPSVTDPGLVGGSGCLAAVSWRGLLCSVGSWTRRPDQVGVCVPVSRAVFSRRGPGYCLQEAATELASGGWPKERKRRFDMDGRGKAK
ncbi:uncharacterized protein LOC125177032 isoform X2 [Prionailurus viverrinus]|uniref:uncharacterized protein LOC125177032 isoform X2 n=1 Tax=Prionailurus viverrinus TaxID=61388 RepID=UPI001FF49790|nr:uncharacterized protein LOC125177032 isoform X2 [Prionailurus viverrinus]